MIIITADEKRFCTTFRDVQVLSTVFECMTWIQYKTEYGYEVFYLHPFYNPRGATIVIKRKAVHEPWRLYLLIHGRVDTTSIVDNLNDTEVLQKAMEMVMPPKDQIL